MVDLAKVRLLDPVALREYLGDGNYGGVYQRSDDEMLAIWEAGVVWQAGPSVSASSEADRAAESLS